MDNYLFEGIFNETPKFNKVVADGIATREVPAAERYADHLYRCGAESFPPGLTYEGYRRCSPRSEYMAITKKRNNVQAFELARSDVFMIDLKFALHGVPLDTQKLYLPYVGEAGEIFMRGSSFFAYPVLADDVISVGTDNLFVRFNRDKLTIERLSAHFRVNGKTETAFMYWANIHHQLKKNGNVQSEVPNDMKTPLFLYLFCKYGLAGAFRKVMNGDVQIGHVDSFKGHPDTHVLCTSTGYKPATMKTQYYRPTTLALLIPESEFTPLVSSMVSTFFYMADHFPDRVNLEDVDDPRQWKLLLGQIIYKSKTSVGTLLTNVDIHLVSTEGYLDAMAREDLQKEGIFVQDIYELFLHLCRNFSTLVLKTDISSMYGKRLRVLRDLMFDITKDISRLIWKLQPIAPEKLTPNEVNKALAKCLKPDRIMEISSAKHGEVGGVSYPGDNKMFKITGNVVLQGDATIGSGNKKSANLSDPAKFLHASIVEAGSLTNQPKSEPTGRTRVNPRIQLSADGLIIPDPARAEMLAILQEQISRK